MSEPRPVARRGALPRVETVDAPVPVGEFLRPIARSWPGVLLGGILGLACALAIAFLQKPFFEAHTLVEIQGPNNDFLNSRAMDPAVADTEAGSSVQTQMKLLESEPIVERVAERLHAAGRSEYRGRGSAPTRQQLLNRLVDDLKVRSLGTSRMVEVAFRSHDPKFAAAFVNTLTGEFIAYSVDSRAEATRTVARQLSSQLTDLKANLEKSENELQQYARGAGLLFTSERDTAASGRLKQVQEQLQKAQEKRVQDQTRYEQALASPPDSLPEVLDDPTLRNYQARLTDLKQQAADLSAVLKPAHYKVKQVEAQIETVQTAVENQRTNILRRLKTEYTTARNRESMLSRYYSDEAAAFSEESARAVRYDVLRREVETNRQLYDAILQKVKEAGIASAVRAAPVRTIAPAGIPDVPAGPKKPLYGAAGLMLGMVAGVLAAFVRPAPAVIRGPGHADECLNVPELAAIPDAGRCLTQGPRHAAATLDEPAGAVQLISWRDPHSRLAEAFRGAAASVLFCTPGPSERVIMVTSACAGEGKTTVSANLAVMFAAAGNRVLLVDGDMRNPSLHRIFGMDNIRGLSDLLSEPDLGPFSLPFELGAPTEIPGLSLLPSGAKLADAGSLLSSPALPGLIERLRGAFDAVVIDTPPLALSDARVFGRVSDGAVFVVKAGQTRAGDASSALERLTRDGTRVLGTIVNRWNPKRRAGGEYGSYLYQMPDRYFKV